MACPVARVLSTAFAAHDGSFEIGDRDGIVVPGTRLCVPLEPPAV